MSKLNRVITLITVLMLSLFASFIINTSKSFANNTSLSVIPSNMTVGVSNTGEVTLGNTGSDVSSAIKALINFIKLLSSIGTIVMLMIFVINFIKLGASGTNANARSAAITALIWSGIATACLSMSTVIFFFFFKMPNQIVENTTL